MFLTVPNGPTHFGRIGLCPPAVQLGEIQAAIDEDLHTTRSAGLPWTSRRVDPKIDPLDQLLGQHHVVVVEEDHASFNLGTLDEIFPLPDKLLSRKILRMSFSRKDQLNRASRIGKQPYQPLGIVQKKIGALIGGKAPRKS